MAGTGKSVVTTELVDRHGFQRVYFGQIVLDEIASQGLRPGPESERRVREQLRLEEGMAVMAARSLPIIRDALARGRRVCIDGLYSGAELEVLAQGVGVITLAVHSPRWLRKARLGSRDIRPLTGDQLDVRDLTEVANIDKATPIALADAHIVNDGDIEALRSDVSAVLGRLGEITAARIDPRRLARLTASHQTQMQSSDSNAHHRVLP